MSINEECNAYFFRDKIAGANGDQTTRLDFLDNVRDDLKVVMELPDHPTAAQKQEFDHIQAALQDLRIIISDAGDMGSERVFNQRYMDGFSTGAQALAEAEQKYASRGFKHSARIIGEMKAKVEQWVKPRSEVTL